MLKNIIYEIDRVAKDLEDVDQMWTFNLVWKLDKIAQELEEFQSKTGTIAKVNKVILTQYLEKMTFLTENENMLTDLIVQKKDNNAAAIYRVMKKHFGKLGKDDSINFINNILENNK